MHDDDSLNSPGPKVLSNCTCIYFVYFRTRRISERVESLTGEKKVNESDDLEGSEEGVRRTVI